MHIEAWIPRIQVIPLRDTKPCGFAESGLHAVNDIYTQDKQVILENIRKADGNGYGYVPNGPVFCLRHDEWERYGKTINTPAYETIDGVFVVFAKGSVPREWQAWLSRDWFVPCEGEGITQLQTGKAVALPIDFLPKTALDTSSFDHDIDWIIRKSFEAGKNHDKAMYAGILACVGAEWDALMEQAWAAGANA